MKSKLYIAIALCVAFIFRPTTVFLSFAMLPTIAIFVADRSVGRNKTICVGAMNFAGAFPFLMKFWSEFGQQTIENAFHAVANAETLLIIYLLAAGGYAIDYAVTGITASLLLQKSQNKLKKINKEQESLVKRWGEKVTGQYKLDDYGFPVRPIPTKLAPPNPDDEVFEDKDSRQSSGSTE